MLSQMSQEINPSYITPESKEQSMEWCHTSFFAKVKAKQSLSHCKIMATLFLDIYGALLVKFMPQG